MVIAAMKLKDTYSLEGKLWPTRQHIKKQRLYFANKGPSGQGYGFSSSHVWIWELDYKEIWVPKNSCFWTVLLEKTFFFIYFYYLEANYSIVVVFVIHWHESAMELHVFPILIPPPTFLSTRSLWVFPVHQVWALVSCIQPGLLICFTWESLGLQGDPTSPFWRRLVLGVN